MKAIELREKSSEELAQLLEENQDSLIRFKLQVATGVVENVRVARNARRDIARILTIIREREIAEAKGTK